MQKTKAKNERTDEQVEEMPEVVERDLSETDDLLDMIDALLDEPLVEEMTFREKARAWASRQPNLGNGGEVDELDLLDIPCCCI